MSWDKVKMFLIAFGTALTAWMGILAIPVYLLVLLGIADGITIYTADLPTDAVEVTYEVWEVVQ